jgi:heat shock protein HslJ
MKLSTSVIKFGIIVFAVACKAHQPVMSTSTNSATALNDIWALEEIEGKAVTVSDFGREIPVLEFHQVDGKVMGNSGCNRLSGTYKVEGNKITFGPMISTKMACPGDGEQRFLTALNSVNGFRIENLKLYLLNGEAEALQFKKVD